MKSKNVIFIYDSCGLNLCLDFLPNLVIALLRIIYRVGSFFQILLTLTSFLLLILTFSGEITRLIFLGSLQLSFLNFFLSPDFSLRLLKSNFVSYFVFCGFRRVFVVETSFIDVLLKLSRSLGKQGTRPYNNSNGELHVFVC